MPKLGLNADEVLTTTRAVRKRLDFERPVEIALIRECLEIALQAPSGSNSQAWHFVLVTDRDKIETIAGYYQQAFKVYEESPAQPTQLHTDDPGMAATQKRVLQSAQYLAANLDKIPAMLIPCSNLRPDTPDMPLGIVAGIFGSTLPAVWSFMLAARERGIGTCWTTLHLTYEKEVANLLNIPPEHAQLAMIPIAHTLGTGFREAPRKSLDGVLHTNGW